MRRNFASTVFAIVFCCLAAGATAPAAQAPEHPRKDLEAQKRTVGDLRNVGTAMFSWLTDQVGAAAAGQSQTPAQKPPTVALADYPEISHADLEKILVPEYITDIPELDGWGHPYEFHLNTENPMAERVMAIRSPGRDGEFSGEDYEVGAFPPDSYDRDLVWVDGFFVQWPERR